MLSVISHAVGVRGKQCSRPALLCTPCASSRVSQNPLGAREFTINTSRPLLMVMVCRGEKEQANGLPTCPRSRGATCRVGGAGCCANLWTDAHSLVVARVSPPALLFPGEEGHRTRDTPTAVLQKCCYCFIANSGKAALLTPVEWFPQVM